MSIKSTTQRIKDLWSLVKGLGVTGDTLLKRTVTVHYPRAEVSNLAGFRGPIALVSRPGDPEKPKCIACLMCMNTCPSNCITVVKMKAPKPAAEQAEGGAEKKAKPAAPKEPQTFIYDYSLCSLCGLCAEVCPVDSICFSSEAYLVARERGALKMDLLAKLKKKVRDASDQKAA
jgi:NADH-quinone oxidoreductase subunit I